MLKTGILNPGLNSLLSRVRHTNTLVIADRGFPSWPGMEIIDISLVDGIPTVLDVLKALLPNYTIGAASMAEEFKRSNTGDTLNLFAAAVRPIAIEFLPHAEFKLRVPKAVGLIRTGDVTQYANIILESA